MASPVKNVKQNQVSAGFTETVERGRGWLKSRNPVTGGFVLDTFLGGRGLHSGAGPYTQANEIDTAWTVGDSTPYRRRMLLADYNAYAGLNDGVTFNAGQIVKYVHPATLAEITFQPQDLQWTNDLSQIQTAGSVGSISATITDDLLRWTNAFGTGRHFEWLAQPTRLSKKLIIDTLASIPTPTPTILSGGNPVLRLQFQLSLSAGIDVYVDGVLWTQGNNTQRDTTGVIEFRSGVTPLWSFAQAKAFDSGSSIVKPVVVQRARVQANNLFIEVRVPWSWIQTAVFPITIDPTIDETVGAGADDAWVAHDFFFDSTDVEIVAGYDTAGPNRAGLFGRFMTVGVPNAATITASKLTIQRFSANVNGSASLRVEAKNLDNAPAPTTVGTFNGSRTAANVTWDLDMTTASDYDSPDISTVVQEVVNRAGWVSDNAMVIIVEGNADSGGYIRAKSYENSTTICPRLHIEYTAGGGTRKFQKASVLGV